MDHEGRFSSTATEAGDTRSETTGSTWRLDLTYGLALAVVPLLLLQGVETRRRAMRLPEAQGEPEGLYEGEAPPIRLLVLGESPVCGIGVEHYRESLGAQLAAALARRSGRSVRWRALGRNGIDAAGVVSELLGGVEPASYDLAIVSLGVNDTTGFTRRKSWRDSLAIIARCLAPIPVLFLQVPPMERFHLLPQPLRAFLGLRARRLDRCLRAFCRDSANAHYLPVALAPEDGLLARDGYHPSAKACERIGAALAPSLLRVIEP